MDTTIQEKNNTYQVIKPLKSGGRGEVLLARDDMDRRVAIKRPFASFADGLERFEFEAQAATLDHPNIAKIYETGTQSDRTSLSCHGVCCCYSFRIWKKVEASAPLHGFEHPPSAWRGDLALRMRVGICDFVAFGDARRDILLPGNCNPGGQHAEDRAF